MENKSNATTGRDSIGKAVRRNLSPRRLWQHAARAAATLKNRGVQALGREIGFRLRLATHREVWRYRADIPLRRQLRAQRRKKLRYMPLISVVVPLYNTPRRYLDEMVESVLRQSYACYELVLVNASDAAHPEVQKRCEAYEKRDARVRTVRLEENFGISGNTNIGLDVAEGDWLVLLDHDDVLQPNALFEVAAAANEAAAELIYSDEIVLSGDLKHLGEYHFKPDFAPDTLRGCNYITHLCAFTRQLLERAGGGEDPRYDGAQDYDLILRLTEAANVVRHIPKVLYFWRRHEASTASGIGQKPYAIEAGAKAVAAQLERLDTPGTVRPLKNHEGAYRVQYSVWGTPLVSVLVPNKDHTDDLRRLLDSLYKNAGWPHMEVLVLENNSTDAATESFYQHAEEHYKALRVVRYKGGFNFAAICNFGAQRAKGAHLLFLNNDMEILSPGFIPELLGYSQRADVGAVGGMLYYPDDTVQHAGLIIGIGGTAGVSHKGHERGNGGDMFRLCTAQNVSAVTGACLMVKARLYEELQGMDEENFAVAFNDVDFCLRLREKGLWNVFTPFAEGYHFESKSRGYDTEGPNKERFDREAAAFHKRHAGILAAGDPFYNPHFTLQYENFGYR